MTGSIDRLEGDKAIIIFDDNTNLIIKNNKNLKEGDRITFNKGKIKKIDNTKSKKEMINLQNKILKRG